MTAKPLAIDLYCGLGGWSEGLLAEGYDVIGFDIERHEYGEHRYPAQLVIQDVLTLHGSQFKDATLIVASPPCQEYSYMAMPWKRAKAKAKAIRADTTGAELERLNRLFNACLRIQFEASRAAGHHVPLVIENVRGAQPWVGRARWSFGSFYLWGDVPALMPIMLRASKVPGFRFDGSGRSFQTASVEGVKAGDAGWRERGPGRQLQDRAIKNNGGSWFNIAHNTTSGKGQNPVERKTLGHLNIRDGHTHARHLTNPDEHKIAEGRKGAGAGAGAVWFDQNLCQLSSKSLSRKAASAMIAKIPLTLSRHIAVTFSRSVPGPTNANV